MKSLQTTRTRDKATWPGVVTALSLSLVGGLVGQRASVLLSVPFDRLARNANGMELLPTTFQESIRLSLMLPANWWIIMAASFFVGLAFVRTRSYDSKAGRALLLALSIVFVVRFVAEGHIPTDPDSLGDYRAHYLVYKVYFLVENAIMCGFAWLGAWGGWKIMEMK